MKSKWFLLVLVFYAIAVAWGVDLCLAHLNQALCPEKEVAAVTLAVLSERSYQVGFLNHHFKVTVPVSPKQLKETFLTRAGASFSHLQRLRGF